MIDIVYALGKGSAWNDNEIRYSLRSVEKHLSDYRNVYIVGECPEWMQNVTHIPYADEHQNRETRIALKVLRACNESSVSDQFLFMNDDHFLLKDCSAIGYPYYHKGLLQEESDTPNLNLPYRTSLLNTIQALSVQGKPAFNYDTHTPILYDKAKFKDVYLPLDWNRKHSYVVKSIYANTIGVDGTFMPDCKIHKHLDLSDIAVTLLGKKVFSISNSAVNGALKKFMDELFPIKSKYEK